MMSDEVRDLVPAQLARFSRESIRAAEPRPFDPRSAITAGGGTRQVMAADIGGDKIITARYVVRDGSLTVDGEPTVHHGDRGSGYLDVLVAAADQAHELGVGLGISYAGPVDGTRVLAGINVPAFMAELGSRYGSDVANLPAPTVLVNDGEAGVMASAVAATRDPQVQHVIYVINGSGLNGAVFTRNTRITTEAGHLELDGALNPMGQTKPCGLLGNTYVCIENVCSSRAGIEDLWRQQRGESLDGRQIAAAYSNGDELARALYANSAFVTAHLVRGIADVFTIVPEWDQTVVVGHGGTFLAPDYGDRVQAILEHNLGKTRMLYTKDFSPNACLDGAAIAALSLPTA